MSVVVFEGGQGGAIVFSGDAVRVDDATAAAAAASAAAAAASAAVLASIAYQRVDSFTMVLNQTVYPLAYDPGPDNLLVTHTQGVLRNGIDYTIQRVPGSPTITILVPFYPGDAITYRGQLALAYNPTLEVVSNFKSVALFISAIGAGFSAEAGRTVAAGGLLFVSAPGSVIAGLPVGFKPADVWSPLHWGCVGDGIADDGANLNIALAAYKTAVEAVANENGSIVFDGLGRGYRSTVSLNFTGVTAWGANIRNLTILSEATGKTAFDMIGTRGATLTEVMVYGHITNTPRVGIQQARADVGGQEAFCDQNIFNGCGTRGYFTLAGLYNYGGESNVHTGCEWWNSHKDGISAILMGQDVYPVASDYLTPITGETSFINNLYDRTEFRHLPLGRTALVTAATNTNPLTVTVNSATPMTIGDNVVFGSTPSAPIVGMPELNQFKAAITGISGNVLTFGAVNASGWGAYTSGGQAIVAQTAPSLVFGRGNGHKFQSCYVVCYGADGIQIDMSASTHQIVALDFDQVLFEGDGQRSHVRFLVGTNSRTMRNFRMTSWAARPQAFVISTDATGAGAVQIQGCVLSFPTESSNGVPTLFENEAKFTIYNGDITVPEVASITPSSFTAYSGKISYISTGFTEYFALRTNGHTRSKIASGATSVDHKYLNDAGVDVGFVRFSTAPGVSRALSLDGTNLHYIWETTSFYPATDDTLDLGLSNRYWQDLYVNRIQKCLAVASLGYAVGVSAGGVVTQVTSKSTLVTLNKRTGTITTTADALAASATVSFRMNNSLLTATSLLIVNPRLPTGKYTVQVIGVDTGFADLRITNLTGGSLSEAITIGFAIIDGANT